MSVLIVLVGVAFFCFFGSCFGTYLAVLTMEWWTERKTQDRRLR